MFVDAVSSNCGRFRLPRVLAAADAHAAVGCAPVRGRGAAQIARQGESSVRIHAHERFALVGPDNGLLLPAAERLGGIVAAHVLEQTAYRLAPVSRTFHGRDIFAPAAAHIARGVPIDALGPAVDPASLVRLDLPAPVQLPGCLEASVVLVDTFGNTQLLAERCDLEAAIGPVSSGDRLTVEPADGRHLGDGDSIDLCWRLAYAEAEAGEPLVCLDSYGRLALAVNLSSAAATYGLSSDRRVRIRRS